MGYIIVIGNAVQKEEEGGIRVRVERVSHPCVSLMRHEPNYNQGNRWEPTYVGFLYFCVKTGLKSIFFLDGANRIRGGYPGAMSVTPEILASVEKAKVDWLSKVSDRQVDMFPTIERLEWLIYWMHWALENTKTPTIEIS